LFWWQDHPWGSMQGFAPDAWFVTRSYVLQLATAYAAIFNIKQYLLTILKIFRSFLDEMTSLITPGKKQAIIVPIQTPRLHLYGSSAFCALQRQEKLSLTGSPPNAIKMTTRNIQTRRHLLLSGGPPKPPIPK